ncbi:MAG: hypothetical protein ACK4N5_15010, partial [Myxococcales bacterium]
DCSERWRVRATPDELAGVIGDRLVQRNGVVRSLRTGRYLGAVTRVGEGAPLAGTSGAAGYWLSGTDRTTTVSTFEDATLEKRWGFTTSGRLLLPVLADGAQLIAARPTAGRECRSSTELLRWNATSAEPDACAPLPEGETVLDLLVGTERLVLAVSTCAGAQRIVALDVPDLRRPSAGWVRASGAWQGGNTPQLPTR